MYVAKHYIGREYVPGEIITEDLSPNVIKRLLAAGAIEKVPGYEPVEKDVIDAVGGEGEDAHETGDAADENGETEDAADENGETEDAAEIDEEAEPEEIDAADGIITAPAPKPETKRGGRSGGGKGK